MTEVNYVRGCFISNIIAVVVIDDVVGFLLLLFLFILMLLCVKQFIQRSYNFFPISGIFKLSEREK